MRRAALIYNPASGQRPARRAALVAKVVAILRNAGVEVEVFATDSPGSAGLQAQQAVRDGCDTILACGGDGTVHEALQEMVGGSAALGIIPMGTANALATDLGLPRSPLQAARILLTAQPKQVSVGRVTYTGQDGQPGTRYFVVAAGVGVDGVFFSRLNSALKQRLGYLVYLAEALRLAVTHTFPLFTASFAQNGHDTPLVEQASQILAVRISNFGGLVNNLAPGAAIGNKHLHVIAFKTRSRLRYLRFMVAVWFRRHTYSGSVALVECSTVECWDLPGSSEPSFVEADGELLGALPARIEAASQTLTLLIPPQCARATT